METDIQQNNIDAWSYILDHHVKNAGIKRYIYLYGKPIINIDFISIFLSSQYCMFILAYAIIFSGINVVE